MLNDAIKKVEKNDLMLKEALLWTEELSSKKRIDKIKESFLKLTF